MLYRLSTYHATPSSLEAVRAAREDGAWPRLERAGAMPLGLWRVMLGGRPGDVIELVRFDSLVHWEQATGAATGDWGELPPEREIGMRPVSRRHPGGEPLSVVPGSVWALRTMLSAAGSAAPASCRVDCFRIRHRATPAEGQILHTEQAEHGTIPT